MPSLVFSNAGIEMTKHKRNVNFTAFPFGIFLVDTSSGAVAATLPAGTNDDIIIFADCVGTVTQAAPTGFGNNPLTIIPDGTETIMGQPNLVLNVDNQAVNMVFNSDTNNWILIGNAF